MRTATREVTSSHGNTYRVNGMLMGRTARVQVEQLKSEWNGRREWKLVYKTPACAEQAVADVRAELES